MGREWVRLEKGKISPQEVVMKEGGKRWGERRIGGWARGVWTELALVKFMSTQPLPPNSHPTVEKHVLL
jgi:hypothetical protein